VIYLTVGKYMNVGSVQELFSSRALVLVVLVLLLLFLIPITSSLGLYRVTFLDVFKFFTSYKPHEEEFIVLWIRLRRVLAGAIIGAILGGAGAIAQAVFRNPLASPYTLGISHAAALGVAVTLIIGYGGGTAYWFFTISRPYLLPFAAFMLAFAQAILVLSLAYKAGLSPYALILSSIALASIYQALLALLQYLILNELQIATIVFWTFGDLGRIGNTELAIMAIGFIPIAVLYIISSLDLDLLVLGDETSYASGVNPKNARLKTITLATLGASLATSFAGVLAFLCLVAPHIARSIVGGSHRYLVPASILLGSILLILSDTISRIALSPRVLPVGIVLSFLGAPLLIFMLLRGSARW